MAWDDDYYNFFSKHVVSFCGLRPQTSTGAPPLGPSGNVGPQTILGPDFQNILRQSYDNAKVTIDLRRTSNLQNILRRAQGFS